MISDVLSDALGKIEDYQRNTPEAYAEVVAEIESLKSMIDGLRMVFDAAPDQSDEHEKLISELRSALRKLDVSGVVAARERLVAWVAVEREKEFQRGQEWAAKQSHPVLEYLAELSQGDLLVLRGNSPPGAARLIINMPDKPCIYVCLNPDDSEYPLIYEHCGERYRTDLEAVVMPADWPHWF
jgi:hypothetical protein